MGQSLRWVRDAATMHQESERSAHAGSRRTSRFIATAATGDENGCLQTPDAVSEQHRGNHQRVYAGRGTADSVSGLIQDSLGQPPSRRCDQCPALDQLGTVATGNSGTNVVMRGLGIAG